LAATTTAGLPYKPITTTKQLCVKGQRAREETQRAGALKARSTNTNKSHLTCALVVVAVAQYFTEKPGLKQKQNFLRP